MSFCKYPIFSIFCHYILDEHEFLEKNIESSKTVFGESNKYWPLLLNIFFLIWHLKDAFLICQKRIWVSIKKDALAKFFSINNRKPNFCNFVRLHSDRAAKFVKIAYIPRGIQNLKNVANLLRLKKFGKFTNNMMIHVENY